MRSQPLITGYEEKNVESPKGNILSLIYVKIFPIIYHILSSNEYEWVFLKLCLHYEQESFVFLASDLSPSKSFQDPFIVCLPLIFLNPALTPILPFPTSKYFNFYLLYHRKTLT